MLVTLVVPFKKDTTNFQHFHLKSQFIVDVYIPKSEMPTPQPAVNVVVETQ